MTVHATKTAGEGMAYGFYAGLMSALLANVICTNATSRNDCPELTAITGISACLGLSLVGAFIGLLRGHCLDRDIAARKKREKEFQRSGYRALDDNQPSALVPTVPAGTRTASAPVLDPVLTSSARMYAAPARTQSFPAVIRILPSPDYVVSVDHQDQRRSSSRVSINS